MAFESVDERTAATAFAEIASRVVWASVATVDADGRPWTRVLHPLWRQGAPGLTGFVLTRPTLVKRRHLWAHPAVAVGYWHPDQRVATANCHASWGARPEIELAWQMAGEQPPPYGYDPASIWPGGPTSPDCAVVVLRPWRLTAASAEQLAAGRGLLWTAAPDAARGSPEPGGQRLDCELV